MYRYIQSMMGWLRNTGEISAYRTWSFSDANFYCIGDVFGFNKVFYETIGWCRKNCLSDWHRGCERCRKLWPIWECNSQANCLKSLGDHRKWWQLQIPNIAKVNGISLLQVDFNWSIFYKYLYWQISKSRYKCKALSICSKCFPNSKTIFIHYYQ